MGTKIKDEKRKKSKKRIKKLLTPLQAYRITVKTTNVLGNTFTIRESNGLLKPYPCKNNCLIIITNDPKKIWSIFSDIVIEKVEKIEPGYKL